MIYFTVTMCAIAITYLESDVNAAPIISENTTVNEIYLLPKTLKHNDEINATGKIANTIEWWWAVSLVRGDNDIACKIKGDKASDTVTINSKIEEDMPATAVFTDFTFIINFIILDGSKIGIRLRESGVEEFCNIGPQVLENIKYITFSGNIQKVDELRFNFA